MTTQDTATPWRLDLWLILVFLVFGFFIGMIEAGRSPVLCMAVQGGTFAACMLAVGGWYLSTFAGGTPPDEREPYNNAVVRAGVIASMFWGIAGMLEGVIDALQLSFL